MQEGTLATVLSKPRWPSAKLDAIYRRCYTQYRFSWQRSQGRIAKTYIRIKTLTPQLVHLYADKSNIKKPYTVFLSTYVPK